jgi:hypothetical protein
MLPQNMGIHAVQASVIDTVVDGFKAELALRYCVGNLFG